MSAAILDRYVGDYTAASGFTATFRRDGTTLFVKPGANPEVPKRQLADLGLMPEDWGGDTVFVEVSAKQKKNLDTLLEMILLVTEIGEHRANPKRAAVGTVLETKLDRGRGPVATVLVQDGTLRVGDNVIAGPMVGRVRALIDDRGRTVKQAGPSSPVELLT